MPFFLKVTRSIARWPGLSVFVRAEIELPRILKSWEILPLLITVKMTVLPAGTLRFESTNLNSDAETVILTVLLAAFGLAPPPGANTPAATPPTASAPSTNRLTPRRISILLGMACGFESA